MESAGLLRLDACGSPIADDVRSGLLSYPKTLPPKLFYDEEGSELFERITELPEYYLTRVERQILDTYAGDMLARAGANLTLVELGAGTAAKTGILIRALLRRQLRVEYYPIDVCESALQVACTSLAAISAQVKVHPVVVDYTQDMDGIHRIAGRKLALYLGSSIGNFEQQEAAAVLRRLRSSFETGDALLLGADLAKSEAVLQPAYDDSKGTTARFNKNVLRRINRELGGEFDLEKFRHIAEWNPSLSRMQMFLESTEAQAIRIELLGLTVPFAPGERIHTENSYKFTPQMTRSILSAGGFGLETTWTDAKGWFSLHLARAV